MVEDEYLNMNKKYENVRFGSLSCRSRPYLFFTHTLPYIGCSLILPYDLFQPMRPFPRGGNNSMSKTEHVREAKRSIDRFKNCSPTRF